MAPIEDVQALAEAAEVRAAEHAEALAADVDAQHESEPHPEASVPAAESSAVLNRLGADGLARLRSRYTDVVGRIAERITDPDERVRLSAAAERLNPDTWGTADEVSAALEQYEAVFESLRSVVGRRPPRPV